MIFTVVIHIIHRISHPPGIMGRSLCLTDTVSILHTVGIYCLIIMEDRYHQILQKILPNIILTYRLAKVVSDICDVIHVLLVSLG